MGATRRLGKPEVVAVVGGLLLLASTVVLTGVDPQAEAGPVAPSFSDVDGAHPFSTEIEWVAAEGIAAGYVDGTFRPGEPVSRQAMSAFLYRFAVSPAGPFPDPGFTDVGAGHPFRTPISWMAHEAITTGYPDGTFRPGAPVTRQSAAAFLHRLEGKPVPAANAPGFFDVTVEHPFHQEVAWLAGEGITTGYPDGSFRPSGVVTRQSMAAFLYRLAHLPEPPPPPPPPPEVELGNPSNLLGSDPIDGAGGNVWLNLGAVASNKQSGDRTTNGNCYSAGVPAGAVSGCAGPAASDDNLDLDPAGHRYLVRVDELAVGEPLRIQVYDPAWTYQGDLCTQNQLSDAQRTALAALPETTMNDAAARFAAGSTRYCVGDQSLNGNMAATSYIVREPDETPDHHLDNPPVDECVRTFSGRNVNATGIYDRLRETTAYDEPHEQGFEQVPFRQHFRQWFTVCTIPAEEVVVGDYVVQVRSNPDTSDLPLSALHANPNVNPGGHNRFALRAGFGVGASSPPDGTGVQVAPTDDVALMFNGSAVTSVELRVARVDETYAGETVELTFFDVGDVGSGSVSLALLAPPDSNVGTFDGCTARRDGVPDLVPAVAHCSIADMTYAAYNGRSVVLRVPIPSSYECDEADAQGCWLRVAMSASGGATPNDTFTLSAGDRTDPPPD